MRSSKKGYTLIEVLVATMIFSLMVSVSMMALNQGLGQYRKLMDEGLKFWDKASTLWLHRSFVSAIDYAVSSRPGSWHPYFKGDSASIAYVTGAPLLGDEPVVSWVVKEPAPAGGFDIMYYELPVLTKTYGDLEEDFASRRYKSGASFAIAKGVEAMKVEYYGFRLDTNKSEWSDSYDSRLRKFMPSLVRITFTRAAGQSDSLVLLTPIVSRRVLAYEQ